MDNELIQKCTATAQQWIDSPLYDAETKAQVQAMLDAEEEITPTPERLAMSGHAH